MTTGCRSAGGAWRGTRAWPAGRAPARLVGVAAVLAVLAVLAGCGRGAGDAPFNGYAEAEFTRMAAPAAGRLVALAAQRGAEVASGALLFTLEQTETAAEMQGAQARLKQAQATRTDLSKGQRPDEVAQVRSSLQAAQADAARSLSNLTRQRTLAHQGFVAEATVVDLQTAHDADLARVRELEHQLRTVQLGARVDQQHAAQAEVQAAQADLAQSSWRFDQTEVDAHAPAHVDDTFYRVGEWVAAGAPVVSLLEPNALKIRFFVPEPQLAAVQPGRLVRVTCDGCGNGLQARVRNVASAAEFTPPVVYSQTNNPRLVFMAEALLAPADAARLRPGLPVEVHLQ
jgi:HlyD family secretion protein